ncbi:MAG: class I SAM-dependent methyltransferase [Bacteroidota bacterium]
MNKRILNNDIQEFINQHVNDDPTKLILKGSPFQEMTIQEIVEQIISKNKCKKKLPTWFITPYIYYPNKLNIEQTSSEITAKYKADLISGKSIIDLTGGFGVDCFAFADKFNEVTHCEINLNLSKIVAHNYLQLGVKNIKTIADDGLKYLGKNKKKYDWIYADPSRRNEAKEKVFLLEECLPNIPLNLDLLFQFTDNILLKLSPLLDISASINELNFIKDIHIIAVKNEVKELLFTLYKGYQKTISIKTVNIKDGSIERFDALLNSNSKATFSLPKKYLYEPNTAILKAGLFNEVSQQLKIDKLHNYSHLYTSNDLIEFPGRRFIVDHILSYDKKQIKKVLPTLKANITKRNFPETVKQIRKRTGIKEGGEIYLFFTTNIENKHLVLVCKKV